LAENPAPNILQKYGRLLEEAVISFRAVPELTQVGCRMNSFGAPIFWDCFGGFACEGRLDVLPILYLCILFVKFETKNYANQSTSKLEFSLVVSSVAVLTKIKYVAQKIKYVRNNLLWSLLARTLIPMNSNIEQCGFGEKVLLCFSYPANSHLFSSPYGVLIKRSFTQWTFVLVRSVEPFELKILLALNKRNALEIMNLPCTQGGIYSCKSCTSCLARNNSRRGRSSNRSDNIRRPQSVDPNTASIIILRRE
jgi:hypothetical protein